MTQPNNSDLRKQIRDAIGCTCAFNEKYDGKSYNLKTEKWEDCECVRVVPEIIQTLISSLPEKDELADTEPRMPRTVYAQGYNQALADIKEIFNPTNKKGGSDE